MTVLSVFGVLHDNVLHYFRGRKTKKNRHFREAVRTGQATGDLGTIGAFSDVSRLDCEEAMVGLQVTTGCSMRLCEEPGLVSELMVTYTKALAEAPYRLVTKVLLYMYIFVNLSLSSEKITFFLFSLILDQEQLKRYENCI